MSGTTRGEGAGGDDDETRRRMEASLQEERHPADEGTSAGRALSFRLRKFEPEGDYRMELNCHHPFG
jgi:hypothetical protein